MLCFVLDDPVEAAGSAISHTLEISRGPQTTLFHSPCVQVAAIRGACPAGGCCMSLCCDFRIMTDFGHIGLNEVALGIAVRLRHVVGDNCDCAELTDAWTCVRLGKLRKVDMARTFGKLSISFHSNAVVGL